MSLTAKGLMARSRSYLSGGGSAYQALKLARAATALSPLEGDYWLDLATIQYNMGLWSEVLDSCSRCQSLGGDAISCRHLEAKVSVAIGEFKKAREFYLGVDSQLLGPSVRWGKALNDLYFGDYSSGWVGYEKRFEIMTLSQLHIYPFSFERWNGVFEPNGSILIHGEQGLGDEIMFAGFIEQLANRAQESNTKIYLACTTPNLEIFSYSFPSVQCLNHRRGPDDVKRWAQGFIPSWLKALPANIKQLPMASLPFALRAFPSQPRASRYLSAIPEDIAHFRAQLHQKVNASKTGCKRVGLAWAANLNTEFGASKSIHLSAFKEISQLDNIQLVSVQSPHFSDQVQECQDVDIIDMSDELTSISKSAALMESLDIIVSVDTSYCHLAGALGKPTLVLLKKDHDWRFGPASRPTSFYSTVKNIRQQSMGNWGSVLSEVRRLIA